MIILHDFSLVMVTVFISFDARLLRDDKASKGLMPLCQPGLTPPNPEFLLFGNFPLADNK